ncbi:MAG: hypothetical protein NC084_02915 [Bacteroides sp.]|nr:hypothetical protein [Eubacterium sp.]MCM1417467.1 hypothetical protein [Roseburia sp.]MCM1461647.1 hypothetical protein [Bacteroides sp.]
MYKNEFKRAFSSVSPRSADDEFIEKVISAAERKKQHRLGGKAAVIPVAIAFVAVSSVAAGAAGGFDLLGAFRSYFSQQPHTAESAELEAAGMVRADELFDAGDYTVRLNGLIADSHYAYLSYDVTYRDEKYFDGGAVAAKYQEGSPVVFFENITNDRVDIHTSGWGEPIAEANADPATVSYVSLFMGEFTPDPATGEYLFSLTGVCADDPSFIAGECTILRRFPINVSVPPAREQTVRINGEIPVSYDRTTVLREASFGPLSVSLRFDNDNFHDDFARNNDGSTIKLILDNGSEIDLSYRSSALFFDEPIGETIEDSMNRETAAAVKAARERKEPAETTAPSDETPQESNRACTMELGYGTAIDPETIAEIELLGKRFSLKQ